MTLSVIDGPDTIHALMGQGCAKIDANNYVVCGAEIGATQNAIVIDTTGGVLAIGADQAWTPSGSQIKNPTVVNLGAEKILVVQLTSITGEMSTVARVGSVNTTTNIISIGAEYALEHTGENIPEWQQLVAVSSSTVIMWYQKQANNGVEDYYGSYYRVITIVGQFSIVSFGAEYVFKDHTNVAGTTTDSVCGFPYAIVRQSPDDDNKIYMIYQNIDTDDDGVFAVSATLVAGVLLIHSDVQIDASVAPMYQNGSVESAISPLNSVFFATGFEYLAAGGYGYAFVSKSNPISPGTIYDLGSRKDGLGFERITNNKFLLVTDGVSKNYARICTVGADKSIIFGTELDLGTAGGPCLGVWVLPSSRALIVVGTQAVIIESDSSELDTETFGYYNIEFYQGTNSLSYKSYLPFNDITDTLGAPGNMARSADKVLFGNAGDGVTKVVTANNDDAWAAWTDLTDSLTDPVNGVDIINKSIS